MITGGLTTFQAELLDAARAGNEEYIVALLKDVGKVSFRNGRDAQ